MRIKNILFFIWDKQCPQNQIYKTCGPFCPDVCGEGIFKVCTERCYVGCGCPEGLKLDPKTNKCVSECPSKNSFVFHVFFCFWNSVV